MQRVPTLALTMSSRGRACTAVLDTNVVLDWLVFRDARVAPLVSAVEAGGLHAFLEHAFVIAIGFLLVLKRSLGPTGQGGLDAFHLHVRTLDDAQADGRSTGGSPLACPGVQLLLFLLFLQQTLLLML